MAGGRSTARSLDARAISREILSFTFKILSMSEISNEFNSDKAPEPVGLYPHARRVGNLLFLSGVGPRERGTKAIPGVNLDANGNIASYDIAKQCHSVFKNVKLILEASGSSWGELADVTVFLTNMKDDFKIYNEIYAEYFKDNKPCRTTVEISSLPTPIAIELKCIATIN
jgi:2-aminomuconate deaminase